MKPQKEPDLTVDELALAKLCIDAVHDKGEPDLIAQHPQFKRARERFTAAYRRAAEAQKQVKEKCADKRRVRLLRFSLVAKEQIENV